MTAISQKYPSAPRAERLRRGQLLLRAQAEGFAEPAPGPAHTLSGNLETNRYRAPAAPIRLDFTDGVDEVPKDFERDEDTHSDNLADFRLQLDGNRLVGETPRLLFRFEPAPAALAEERRRAVEAKLAAAEQALLRIVRAGAVYEGRTEGLPYASEGVQLRFTKVENRGTTVEIQLVLGKQTDPFDTLTGRLVVADRLVRLNRPGGESRRRVASHPSFQSVFERVRLDGAKFLQEAAEAAYLPFRLERAWLLDRGDELELRIEESRLVLVPRPNPFSSSMVFPLKP